MASLFKALRRSPFVAAVLLCLWLSLVVSADASDAAPPPTYVQPTSRRYTMLVEELTAGLDEAGTRPTLVSVMEETTLTLPTAPNASAAWEGDSEASEVDAAVASDLTFDEDFDPIWYYVLRRRGFEHLDWSGCGGKWRPEWAIPKHTSGAAASSSSSTAGDETALMFGELRHYLAHHAVCTYSSVSFCGASRERDADSQFQWAAQFISTLTSSPLSWTAASPRHTRPNGVLLASPLTKAGGAMTDRSDVYWCSYHLVYHDTLCTQHVSPLLNGGRSGRGVQEGLPRGIFKAAIPSFVHFFGTPFHHFTVKATQERRPANNASAAAAAGVVELRVQMRMSLVARERAELAALAEVWSRELPAYAAEGRLEVRIGPGGLSKRLRAALPASAVVSSSKDHDEKKAGAKTEEVKVAAAVTADAVGWSPEVHYEVHSHGKDHGYLTVELQPTLSTFDAQSGLSVGHGARTGAHQFRLRAGDVVRTLLLFPLHLTRPSLYNMESLVGATRLVHAHTDVSSNTLAVLLETPVTAVHVAAYEAAYARARERHRHGGAVVVNADRQRRRLEGVLLGRFPLFFGWTALREMPPDDNSNRIIPQPVVVITRHANTTADADDFCAAQRRDGGRSNDIPPLDHVSSLSAVFELLNQSFVLRDGRTSRASVLHGARSRGGASALEGGCVYWVRSTVASGTTIPGPDGAMVFNVLSLGLVFSAVGAGMLTRLTRRLTLHPEGLAALEKEEAR